MFVLPGILFAFLIGVGAVPFSFSPLVLVVVYCLGHVDSFLACLFIYSYEIHSSLCFCDSDFVISILLSVFFFSADLVFLTCLHCGSLEMSSFYCQSQKSCWVEHFSGSCLLPGFEMHCLMLSWLWELQVEIWSYSHVFSFVGELEVSLIILMFLCVMFLISWLWYVVERFFPVVVSFWGASFGYLFLLDLGIFTLISYTDSPCLQSLILPPFLVT